MRHNCNFLKKIKANHLKKSNILYKFLHKLCKERGFALGGPEALRAPAPAEHSCFFQFLFDNKNSIKKINTRKGGGAGKARDFIPLRPGELGRKIRQGEGEVHLPTTRIKPDQGPGLFKRNG